MSVSCGFGAAAACSAASVISTRIDLHDADSVELRVGATCYSGFKVDSNSYFYERVAAGGYTLLWQWMLSGVNSDYEVRCTVNSGSVSGSSTGSWLACTADRFWYVSRSSTGTTTANITIEIRDASTLAVLDSSTHGLSAEYQTL